MARIRLRKAQARLYQLIKQFPICTILGPRQAGKSTLAKSALRDFKYFDLENPTDFTRFEADPTYILQLHKNIIIDEAQRLPDLFTLLRSFIDVHPTHKIVLLGSASPVLVGKISESLVGRTGLLELTPLLVSEHPWKKLWIQGAFPRLHWSVPRAKPQDWYSAYLQLYLERDLPQLDVRIPAIRMRRFLQMLASQQGQICNLSEFGSSLGINYHSVQNMIDLFEGTFLVRRLQPFFANIGKRLVKSPKIYIRDSGLLHSLLGLEFHEEAILSSPKAGFSFEGFWVEQIMNTCLLKDPLAEGFYWRTHTGVEVDLLLKFKGKMIPLEIKMTHQVPSTEHLEICMKDLNLKKGYVLYLGKDSFTLKKGITILTPVEFLKILK